MFAQDPCADPNTRTALCQPGSLPPPKELSVLMADVEAVLEDGGKPASRPDFVYSEACHHKPSESSWGICRVQVILKGFREVILTPNSRGKTTVVLQRMGAEGDAFPKNMVSVAALSMPPAAHKAYAKGEAAAGLRDNQEAEKWFRLAVKEFPGHALAWDELGQVLEALGKPEEARAAYEHSAKADPRLARPYVHLAGLAVVAKRWEEAAALSGRALALQPTNFPRAWFYDALANYNLKKFAKAEQSALETIRLDPSKSFPLAQDLLDRSRSAR